MPTASVIIHRHYGGVPLPFRLCPECLDKLKLANDADMKKRFDALIAFHGKHGFTEEAEFYQQEKTTLEDR